MPQKEAQDAVDLYRNKLAKVPQYWKKLNKEIDKAYDIGHLSLPLPSGRSLNYGNIRKTLAQGRIQFVSSINRNGQKRIMKLWGGVLAENLSQALARDIFSFMMLEIDKAGIDIIFHVHDEVICECDEDEAEEVLQKITKIMSTPPEWISDIPLDAEGEILTQYQK